jgi:transketolase
MPIFSNQLFDYNFGYLPPQPATTTFNITYDDLRPATAAGTKRLLHETRVAEAAVAKRGKRLNDSAVDTLAINTIRCLSADMVQAANSGHPGAPMGCAPMAHALWAHIMHYSPSNPKWINRDRFVLSNGHACALLYSLLHLSGFELSMDDLKSFRKLDSKCPGHPENFHTVGVEVTTGPLGQGLSMAVGMALASAQAAATYNREGFELLNNYTYVICGDGCLQEGVTSEASSLAGHLGLGRLIVMWDDNRVTIDGSTDLSFTEDVLARYASYGWHTLHVARGDDDLDGILTALEQAKAETDRPTMIRVSTTIGKGSAKEGTGSVHGSPLGEADIANMKKAWGFDESKSFHVADDVYAQYARKREEGQRAEADWKATLQRYAVMHPALAAEFNRRFSAEMALPADWEASLPTFTTADKQLATRQSSQLVLNKLCESLPDLIGGSADLTPSNLTKAKGALDFQRETPEGRYIRFGVREHAMAAICNGISAFGGFVPFCATFLNFAG